MTSGEPIDVIGGGAVALFKRRTDSSVLSATYVLGFGLVGVLSAMLGPSLTTLSQISGSSFRTLGILFTADSFGSVCGSLFAGCLMNRISTHLQAILSLVSIAVLTALLPSITHLSGLLLAWWALGLSKTFLIVTVNTLFVWIHRRNPGPRMNLADFFLGLGALLMPIGIAQSLMRTGELQWAYGAVGALALVMIVPLVVTYPGPVPEPRRTQSGAAEVARSTNYLVVGSAAALLFVYVGAELSFSGWIPSYALDRGIVASERTAAYYTSLFWVSVTAGRLLWLPFTKRVSPERFLAASVAGCLVSIGLICLRPSSAAALTADTICFGLSMSCIFPSVFTMLSNRVGVTGQVSGISLCAASLGAMFFPWWIGHTFLFHR